MQGLKTEKRIVVFEDDFILNEQDITPKRQEGEEKGGSDRRLSLLPIRRDPVVECRKTVADEKDERQHVAMAVVTPKPGAKPKDDNETGERIKDTALAIGDTDSTKSNPTKKHQGRCRQSELQSP